MANTGSDNSPYFDTELHKRFPRAGYWFGMLPTHPNINPETTLEPSPGRNADREDAQATVAPQGDHELVVFIVYLLMHVIFSISLATISYILNPSEH